MAAKRLRVGVIGLGDVAVAHLEGYRDIPEIEVVAGADIRADRLVAMATRYGFRPYADYRELLVRERPDIACVLTTVNSHRQVVEAAADQGVHVLCEKPLAVRLEDAEAMIARCRERGVKLFYAASYRFLPPVRRARELIREGRLGDVHLLIETMLGGTGTEGYQSMGFEHYPKGGPGGSGWGLMDHGIHLIDIFGWLISSEVAGVFGRGQISGEPPGPEFMVADFRSGALGQLLYDDASWSADLPGEGLFSWGPGWFDLVRSEPPGRGGTWQEQPGNIRVYGTKGALRIYHYANQLFLRTAAGMEQIRVLDQPMPGQFGAELASFARSVRDAMEPEVPGEVGLEALRAVLAAYESMRTGRRAPLPERR